MPESHEVLTFAVLASAKTAATHLEPLAARLGAALGCRVEGKIFMNYAGLFDAVVEGRAQIVWAPPRLAAGLHLGGHGTIALGCKRGGALGYYAALFTRHTSPFEKLADLKGAHVAWVDPKSSAGYLVPRKLIAEAGFDPERFFGRESVLGSHELVAAAVLSGGADVGATYVSLDPLTSRPLSAGWLEAGAAVNGAFIVATAGPIPPDAIVLANHLPVAERARVTTALVEIARDAPALVGNLFGAEGLAPPDLAAFTADT